MRKAAIIGLTAAIAVLGLLFIVSQKLPSMARTQVLDVLAAAGFNTVTMPDPQVRLGAVRYEGIILDADKISTIGRLEAHYSPFSLLFSQDLQSVSIDDLSLTGEMAADGTISLAGWQKPGTATILKMKALKTLTVKNGKISLLTKKFGGLSLGYDLQARRRKKGIEIQATAKSGQKGLSFDSSISANINKDGLWQASIELEQGKFEIEPIRANRLNGTVQISGALLDIRSVLSELNAGGINLYGFPWQNAAATIEKENGGMKISFDAKSIGVEGLELSGTFDNTDGQQNIAGSLQAESLSNLLAYLGNLEILQVTDKTLAALGGIKDLGIDIQAVSPSTDESRFFQYAVTGNAQPLPVGGTIKTDAAGNFEGILTGQPFFLNEFEKLLRGENPGQPHFTGGHVTISGNFSKKKPDPLAGWLKLDVADGDFSFGGLNLAGITGPLLIDNLSSLGSSGAQSLTCRLPVKKSLQKKCTLDAEIRESAINVKKLSAELFSGKVEAENYNLGPALTLKVNDIDLWELTSALGIEGLSATGRANAALPLQLEDGKLVIKDGVITSKGEGVFHFEYAQTPSFFKGDQFEQEAMKQALQNYHYDSFEIRISGDLGGEPEITITANGTNPESFENRPVALNMKTKASLAPLFKNIAGN